jgi:hypothetical protein
MTYEQLCDLGVAADRQAACERAEDLIRDEQELEIAEQIASGTICLECGAPLQVQQHRPARCSDCGGNVAPTPWVVCGTYYSDPAAAHAARQQYIAKRNRLAERMRRAERLSRSPHAVPLAS